MLAVFVSYIAWVEVLVRPLNSFPEGKAANGLPYPFLNDMVMDERLVFYATTIGTAVVFMLIGWVVSRVIVKLG